MKDLVSPDLYRGNWEGLTFQGEFRLSEEPNGMYSATFRNGRSYKTLHLDKWQNLCDENLCFSLHGKAGMLFGIENLVGPVPYSVFAARRDIAAPLRNPVCGEDGPLFELLLNKPLRVRALETNGPQPIKRDDTIEIHKNGGQYEIGRISDKGEFEGFDQLCPDLANGTLNSQEFRDGGLLRNVTCWDQGNLLKVFGMLTVATEVLKKIHRDFNQGAQLLDLARKYNLLPFELSSLLGLSLSHGDPLLIWGADDGG